MKKLLVLLSLIFSTVSYADTETIEWYVDGSVYNTTTCQSGGNVTLPTQPTKTGYTFVGWEVALYDFSTLDPSVAANNFISNSSNQTWSVPFEYGVVSGEALCSSTTTGTYAVVGTPDESAEGGTKSCWCKATEYVPTGSDITYENTSLSAWVFRYTFDSSDTCAGACAFYCGSSAQSNAAFRRALFGVTQ